MGRIKTKYPGVFYRETKRIGRNGTEKIFYIIFKRDGKNFEEKVGRQHSDNMTMAKAAIIRAERIENKRLSRKEIREEKKALAEAEKKKMTVNKLWTEYKANNPDLKGIYSDDNRFKNYIAPVFGDKQPGELLPLEVDRLRITLLKKRAPATVRGILEVLRRAINFGINKNLCEGIKFRIQMPKVNNEKTEYLSPEQMVRLLEAINQDSNKGVAAMMKLAIFTGIRRGELFRLQWKDINYQNGFITLRDPKGGPDQKIPLNDEARALLKAHRKIESPYVFPGRNGKQRVNVKAQVNKIKKKAGLAPSFRGLHGLRHNYASMLASSGQVDMYTLQKLLTHKSPKMTQRYAHLHDMALKKASNLVGELISANK